MNASQKNGLLIGITIAALGGAGFMFYRSSGTAAAPTRYSVNGVCLDCGKSSTSMHVLGEHEPYVCPSCQKNAVYPWFVCTDCRKRFVPELDRGAPGEPARLPHTPRCPACGSTAVSAWDAELVPESDLKGDVALPKLGG